MISTLRTFTDGMIAIIATIMALSIPLPIALRDNHYKFGQAISALIIFFVSFLIVLSYYFQFVKFFEKIRKLSGGQIFAYVIFLFLLSLFPFMTQLNSEMKVFTLPYFM